MILLLHDAIHKKVRKFMKPLFHKNYDKLLKTILTINII